jgi:hypothetical protein
MPDWTIDRDEYLTAVSKLLDYCRREHWRGYDPYDGLNSPLTRVLPRTKFFRTAFTQFVKRSPINLRQILGIRKQVNPKGVALGLRAIALLVSSGIQARRAVNEQSDGLTQLDSDLNLLTEELLAARVANEDLPCWGYNFDWQSRAFFAPRNTPNVVCTTTVANALLDRYELDGSERALEAAVGSCRFLADRINRTEDGESFCFSYTPLDRSAVHNVNMLGAGLLARAHKLTGEAVFRELALSAASYTLSRQRPDGEWFYGEGANQRWIDSFHTGFILVSIRRMIEDLGTLDWAGVLDKGYEFYTERFFLADGTPGYYHDRLYPIDVHSAAQAVITFCEMTDLKPNATMLATRAVEWATKNLQAPAGYFYFQRHRAYTNKIPYMRWSQAWMLYALSLYLTKSMGRNDV